MIDSKKGLFGVVNAVKATGVLCWGDKKRKKKYIKKKKQKKKKIEWANYIKQQGETGKPPPNPH